MEQKCHIYLPYVKLFGPIARVFTQGIFDIFKVNIVSYDLAIFLSISAGDMGYVLQGIWWK